MSNARIDESQVGIKIAGRNINKLRYADDTILVAESEKELKSLLMRMKKRRVKKLAWNSTFKKLTSWHLVPSVQFSRSVVSDSFRPHESQHARPTCPLPTPGAYPNSYTSSQWCHPAISSSVVPFSSCPNPSQHQNFFQWVNSSHQVVKVLEFQL